MQVLIIDSSILILDRVEELLLNESKVAKVYKATNYKSALSLVKKTLLQIVVISSINNIGAEALETINKIKNLNKSVTIIVLLNNEDGFVIEHYKRAGVKYLLDKYNDFLELPAIINSVS